MKPFPNLADVDLYLVGGCVRDQLMGKEPKDRDFVALTDLDFDGLVATIERAGGTIFMAKPEFLTVRCRLDGEALDITLPRDDGVYSDLRHPDSVRRTYSLAADAGRRDFTINAMYMDASGAVLDWYTGKQDLLLKHIRAVGSPLQRFQEDPLRILRAVRFSVKLDFSIDGLTLYGMRECAKLLYTVSADRIRDELNQALAFSSHATYLWIDDLALWPLLFEKGLKFQLTSANL